MQDLMQMSDQLAYQFFQSKMYKQAHTQSEITLSLEPLNKGVRFNTAKCAYYANEYWKALEHINVCLMLDPNDENAKRELALYLPWVGSKREAKKIINELPKDDRTLFNMGWYHLMDGNFLEGMICLNHGRKINCWGTKDIQMPTPEWMGERGRVFVINEGGYGDEIIFARFLKDVKDLNCKVYVKSSPEMRSIFSRMDCVEHVTSTSMYPEHDYWVGSMALPVKLGSSDVSGEPYIEPCPIHVRKWKEKLDLEDFNIGIRWEGGQLFEHDQRRTLPINELVTAIGSYGKLFSLQDPAIRSDH